MHDLLGKNLAASEVNREDLSEKILSLSNLIPLLISHAGGFRKDLTSMATAELSAIHNTLDQLNALPEKVESLVGMCKMLERKSTQ
jgi:hypothetical protein